jgi:hypothetical protein
MNSIIQLFKDILFGRTVTDTGALPHVPQPNDIHFNDVVASANPVNWITKTSYRMFPDLNQYYSSECGAFSARKYLGIHFQQKYGHWIDFEEADIYQRRVNRPQLGMNLSDIFSILSKGVTLKTLTNVKNQTDADADNALIEQFEHDVGSVFSITGTPVYINAGDIDTIASVIQTTGKGVIIMVYFLPEEWGRYVPQVLDTTINQTSPNTLKHYVVATDYTLYNGQKCLVIEDSAWFGGINRRVVTEAFLKARNIANAYGMNFKFENSAMPKYTGSIISFQQCMQAISLFPTNVATVEIFGPLSQKACKDFQTKYQLPVTGQIDSLTVTKLYQLFN